MCCAARSPATSPTATDCAVARRGRGGRVQGRRGDPRLLKVTTPEDLALVESLARARDRRLPHAPARPEDERIVAHGRGGRALRRDRGRARRRRDRLHRARLLLPADAGALVAAVPARALRLRPRRLRRRRARGEAARPARSSSGSRSTTSAAARTSSRALLEPYPWDYLLGSVHWIDGLAVDQEPELWSKRVGVDEVWRRYFVALAEPRASGHVDVLAHPDLAKIFGDVLPVGLDADVPDALEAASRSRSRPPACTSRVGELYPDRRSCARRTSAASRSRSPRTRTCPQNVGRDLDRGGRARARGRLRDRDRVRGRAAAPGAARMSELRVGTRRRRARARGRRAARPRRRRVRLSARARRPLRRRRDRARPDRRGARRRRPRRHRLALPLGRRALRRASSSLDLLAERLRARARRRAGSSSTPTAS